MKVGYLAVLKAGKTVVMMVALMAATRVVLSDEKKVAMLVDK